MTESATAGEFVACLMLARDRGQTPTLSKQALDQLIPMLMRYSALLGVHPEKAQLCHDGHEPIVHFSECPVCAMTNARGHAWAQDGEFYVCEQCGAVSREADDSECRLASGDEG